MKKIYLGLLALLLLPFGLDAVPQIQAVYASPNLENAVVLFTEDVDDSALNPAHYAIDKGLNALRVERMRSKVVRLITSAQTPHENYTLTVNGVSNVAGEPIVPNSSMGFKALYPVQRHLDFSSVPPGSQLVNAARVHEDTLKLTDAIGSTNGAFTLPNFYPGEKYNGFVVRFDVFLGDGSIPIADGFSFCLGTDVAGIGGNCEGVGSGLRVAFDSYDNGGGLDGPAIEIRNQGISDALPLRSGGPYKGFPTLETTQFTEVLIHSDTEGRMNIFYDGQLAFTNLLVFTNKPTGQAYFGANTGGAWSTHWVKNLDVSFITENPENLPPTLDAVNASGSTVVLSFSEAMAKHPAENLANYVFQTPITRAVLSEDWTSVTLTLSEPLCADEPYSISVKNLTDRAPYPNKISPTSLEFIANPVWPADLGTEVNGIQDDFQTLGTPWVRIGDPSIWNAQDGRLVVTNPPGTLNYLLLNRTYNPNDFEILTRMKVIRMNSGNGGRVGVILADDAEAPSAQGIRYDFQNEIGRRLALTDEATQNEAANLSNWESDTYYWLRIKSSDSQIQARSWLANGDEAEPGAWASLPAKANPGRIGFAAFSGTEPVVFEIDYFLIKSGNLPMILISPEAACYAPPTPPLEGCGTLLITRGVDEIVLSWTGACLLQSASNVSGPYSLVPGNPSSPVRVPLTQGSSRFFRLTGP